MQIEPFSCPNPLGATGLLLLGTYLESLELENTTGMSVGVVCSREDPEVMGFVLCSHGRIISALAYDDCVEDIWSLVDALHCYFESVEPGQA